MTLNELRTLCIKYTLMDDEMGLTKETYSQYIHDSNYKDLFNNVTSSINRAVSRIISKEKLNYKTFDINPVKTTSPTFEYQLDDTIHSIQKVIYNDGTGFYYNVDYKIILDRLVLPRISSGYFIVAYIPEIEPFQEFVEGEKEIELKELGITNQLCNVIQYFAKADLWEKEEPALSQSYRGYAEQYLDDIKPKRMELPTKVASVFHM